jgi:hypothetical protein
MFGITHQIPRPDSKQLPFSESTLEPVLRIRILTFINDPTSTFLVCEKSHKFGEAKNLTTLG